MRSPHLSKADNFRTWVSGGLGNRLRVWRTLAEYRASEFLGPVVLRYLGDLPGGPCLYNLPPEAVEPALREIQAAGWDLNRVMVNEAAPDYDVVVQGEYLNDVLPGAVEAFLFSRVRRQMRDALAEASEEVRGLSGRFLLRAAMTPSSWADFEALLELYSGHVLEVSVYRRTLGDLPGRNALVWEVRRY